MSAPIRSAGGWRIVRLTDRKASVTRPLPEVRDQIVGTAMSFGDRCLMKPSWVRRKLKSASFTLGISSIGINFIYMRRMDDAAWARTQSMNSLSRYARWRTFDTRQHSGDRIFLLAGPRKLAVSSISLKVSIRTP